MGGQSSTPATNASSGNRDANPKPKAELDPATNESSGNEDGNPKPKAELDPVFDESWRTVDWTTKESMVDFFRTFQLSHPEFQQFRILLHGPVGAGKSCFINSVCSVFKGRIVGRAEEETSAGKSCTKTYKGYRIMDSNSTMLPFILTDLMGLEEKDEDGIHPEDIINAMRGNIKEGYKFNPTSPLSLEDPDFVKDPSPSDKVHCLVSVMAASRISLVDNKVINKMKHVREKALKLGIPHVILVTKVDEVSPLVKEDLTQVYKSKKVKEKMEKCSHDLGPPVKFIFPVSNYYEESETNKEKDFLILMALKAITLLAKDALEDNS